MNSFSFSFCNINLLWNIIEYIMKTLHTDDRYCSDLVWGKVLMWILIINRRWRCKGMIVSLKTGWRFSNWKGKIKEIVDFDFNSATFKKIVFDVKKMFSQKLFPLNYSKRTKDFTETTKINKIFLSIHLEDKLP